jgi:hypothetical protein
LSPANVAIFSLIGMPSMGVSANLFEDVGGLVEEVRALRPGSRVGRVDALPADQGIALCLCGGTDLLRPRRPRPVVDLVHRFFGGEEQRPDPEGGEGDEGQRHRDTPPARAG